MSGLGISLQCDTEKEYFPFADLEIPADNMALSGLIPALWITPVSWRSQMQWRREESRGERPSLLKTVRGNRKSTSVSMSIRKKNHRWNLATVWGVAQGKQRESNLFRVSEEIDKRQKKIWDILTFRILQRSASVRFLTRRFIFQSYSFEENMVPY